MLNKLGYKLSNLSLDGYIILDEFGGKYIILSNRP
jgi:hypothetical protein